MDGWKGGWVTGRTHWTSMSPKGPLGWEIVNHISKRSSAYETLLYTHHNYFFEPCDMLLARKTDTIKMLSVWTEIREEKAHLIVSQNRPWLALFYIYYTARATFLRQPLFEVPLCHTVFQSVTNGDVWECLTVNTVHGESIIAKAPVMRCCDNSSADTGLEESLVC